jgi:hypothetical protein
MDNNLDDELKGKITGFVSSLRDNISAAFSEDGKTVNSDAYKYLLFLKDIEIAEKNDELAKLTDQLDKLADFISKSKALSLASAAEILDADDIVIWKQRGDRHVSETFGLSPEKGEEIFMEVLPALAEASDPPSGFCSIGNYIAHTLNSDDGLTVAALFIRRSFKEFTRAETKMIRIISEFLLRRPF